jgi:hypothetical protein
LANKVATVKAAARRRTGKALKAGALSAAAGGGPGGEGFQVAAIFPGEVEKFAGVEVGSFFAEEGFKTPLDVGAFPGPQAIAAGGEPVELE